MDALKALCNAGKWNLNLPITVRGNTISEMALTGPVVRASAEEPPRIQRFTDPMMEGPDVRAVQEALKARGHSLSADGVFGPGTEKAVIEFQKSKGLLSDGIVGPATRSHLGLDD